MRKEKHEHIQSVFFLLVSYIVGSRSWSWDSCWWMWLWKWTDM